MAVMPRFERWEWLVREIAENQGGDILDRDFVDAYVQATGAAVAEVPYGAARCRLLSQDLLGLVRCRALKRHRTGLSGMSGLGFPRWVWSYQPSPLCPPTT